MLAMQTEEDIRSIKRCGGSYRTLYTDLTEDHSDGSHLTPRDGPQCGTEEVAFLWYDGFTRIYYLLLAKRAR